MAPDNPPKKTVILCTSGPKYLVKNLIPHAICLEHFLFTVLRVFLFFHTHVTNPKLTLCLQRLGSTWSKQPNNKAFQGENPPWFFFFPED